MDSDLPSPSERFCHQATHRCSRGGSSSENDVQITLPDSTVAQWHNVRQQNGSDSVDAAATYASDRSGYDELPDILRQPTSQDTHSKDDIGEEETLLSAEYVAQLAIQWLTARQGQKVPK